MTIELYGLQRALVHEDEVAPVTLCFLDLVHLKSDLDAPCRTLDGQKVVDHFLGGGSELCDPILKVCFD